MARHVAPSHRRGRQHANHAACRRLFLNRSDRSFHRKIEETMLALQIERHYTKEQIFTMYCNQIYLGSGTYGFEAASEYYFRSSCRKSDAVTGGNAGRNHSRADLFADGASGAGAGAEKSGAGFDVAGREDHARSNMRKRERRSRWACTFPDRETISLPILSRRSGNISNTRTERRRCTSRGCACTRR